MVGGTNTPARVAHSGAGGISDVQNVPGTYYASALLNGRIDWEIRSGDIFLVKHGTGGNSSILYGLSGPSDQLFDTGVDIGSVANGSDLIVLKITSQVGNDEMRIVVNPN